MDKFSELVLKNIQDLSDRFDKFEDKMVAIQLDIAKLKVKSGIWGAIAGTIPVAIAIIVALMWQE